MSYAKDMFHVQPDEWQTETLRAAGGDPNPARRLMMKACTGPGKSAVLAWLGWHRLSCFADKGEHPKGFALSGEGRDNLRDNLWSELAKWQRQSEFLQAAFTWNKEMIFAKDHSETWFLSARSYAKDADTEAIGQALSGLHSRYPFALLDETGRMPVTVGQKATQILTGGVVDGLIAGAGNPVTRDGLLYHACINEKNLWFVVTITADPDDPKRTPRVKIEHAREQINQYGRDNPWVMSTILGLFPLQGFNALFSSDDVERALGKHLTEDVYSHSQKRLGVDVARFGDDRTVIFPRQGLAAFRPVIMRNARSNEIAARVLAAKAKWGSEMEAVDGTGGWGSGVVDSMIQAGQTPLEISFSGKAIDPRYYNKRSEMWFQMSEWVKRGGALPNIPEMLKELTSPTYTLKDGRFLIEPKELIKARIGTSPDLADALCLTFALPEMPTRDSILGMKEERGTLRHDWNPFEDRLPN